MSDGGMWIDGLALFGLINLVYWMYRIAAAVQRMAQEEEEAAHHPAPPAAAPAAGIAVPAVPTEPAAIPPEHVAAIAAAVATMMGSHRIVHIDTSHSGATWTAEGRWMHQTSHSRVH